MAINPVAVVQNENARLKDENATLKEELRSLHEFVEIVSDLFGRKTEIKSDAELLPMLNGMFLKMLKLINAPDGSLALLDEDADELVFVLVSGALSSDLTGYRMPADVGIAGWVVQNVEAALVHDVRRDSRFSDLIDDAFKFRTQSLIAAPLIGSGKVFGVIEALNQPGDVPFSEIDLALLSLLCRAAGERLANIEHTALQEDGA